MYQFYIMFIFLIKIIYMFIILKFIHLLFTYTKGWQYTYLHLLNLILRVLKPVLERSNLALQVPSCIGSSIQRCHWRLNPAL